MEARRELFDILFNGLSPDDQADVLRLIAENTERKRRQIETATVHEELRLQLRSEIRAAASHPQDEDEEADEDDQIILERLS